MLCCLDKFFKEGVTFNETTNGTVVVKKRCRRRKETQKNGNDMGETAHEDERKDRSNSSEPLEVELYELDRWTNNDRRTWPATIDLTILNPGYTAPTLNSSGTLTYTYIPVAVVPLPRFVWVCYSLT